MRCLRETKVLQKSVNFQILFQNVHSERTFLQKSDQNYLFVTLTALFPLSQPLCLQTLRSLPSSSLLSPSTPFLFDSFRKNSSVQFFSLFVLSDLPERCFQPRIYHPHYNRLVKGSPLSALHFVLLLFSPLPLSFFHIVLFVFLTLGYTFFHNKIFFRSILSKNRISFSSSFGRNTRPCVTSYHSLFFTYRFVSSSPRSSTSRKGQFSLPPQFVVLFYR